MELEMDVESRQSNADFQISEPVRSESFVSETSYKYLGSDTTAQKV